MAGALLIDGNSCLLRYRYAISPRVGEKGRLGSLLYRFVRFVLREFHAHAPDFGAVLLSEPSPLISSKALGPLLQAAGISLLQRPGCTVGQLAQALIGQAQEKNLPVTLISTRKSFLQLVRPRVCLLHPGREGLRFYPPRVEKLFGVSPEQIPDLLALVGEKGEGILGVSSIGPKKAASLLQQFGSVEKLLDHLEELTPALRTKLSCVAQELRAGKGKVLIPKTRLPIRLEECSTRQPDTLQASREFSKVGLADLLTEILPHHHPPEVRYETVLTQEHLSSVVDALHGTDRFAVDTETTGLDPLRMELVGISLCTHPQAAFYIPVGHRYEGVPGQLSISQVAEKLQPIFSDPQKLKVGQNLIFDLQVLAHAGLPLVGPIFDTLVASYLISPDRRSHSLDALSMVYLGMKMIPIHELIGTEKTMAQVEIGKVTEYACEDADATLQIYERLAPLLAPSGHRQLFEDVEMPFLLALSAMEQRGIPLEEGRLESLCEEGKERLQGFAEEIFSLAGEVFDLGSPVEIRRILKGRIGGIPRTTRAGQLSLKRGNLQAIAELHPIVPKLLNFLDWKDLLYKRIPILSSKLDPEVCRLHLGVHPAATGTGGFRMSRFFNLPESDRWDDRLRSLVKAPIGFSLLEARYLQLEDRLLAHRTQDPELFQYLQSERSSPPPETRHLKQRLLFEAKRKGEVRTLLGRIRKIHQLNDPNPTLRQAAQREALATILQGSIADLLKLSVLRLHKALRRELPESHLIFIEPDGLLVEVRDGQEAHASELLRQAMEGAFSLWVPLKVQLRGGGIRWSELR